MGTIRTILGRNPKLSSREINIARQLPEHRRCMNPDPEYARRLRGWEESISSQPNVKRGCSNLPQTLRDRGNLLHLLLADKLQRHMQRFRPHPPRLGSKSADALKEARNPPSNFVVEIDPDKDTHGKVAPATRWQFRERPRPRADKIRV